jgi:hypothetical protein
MVLPAVARALEVGDRVTARGWERVTAGVLPGLTSACSRLPTAYAPLHSAPACGSG